MTVRPLCFTPEPMKSIHFTYVGPDVNLGRFGAITKGTSLPLNAAEARDVMRDKRFVKSEKPFTRLEFKPTPAPENETPAEVRIRISADDKRSALFDALNRCFDDNEKEQD